MFVDMYDKKILGKLHKFQKEYKTTIVLHVVKNEAKFVDVCLSGGVYCPAREFFTHMETSPLRVKGCKF